MKRWMKIWKIRRERRGRKLSIGTRAWTSLSLLKERHYFADATRSAEEAQSEELELRVDLRPNRLPPTRSRPRPDP